MTEIRKALWVSEETHKRLKIKTSKEGKSIIKVVQELIDNYLDEEGD